MLEKGGGGDEGSGVKNWGWGYVLVIDVGCFVEDGRVGELGVLWW